MEEKGGFWGVAHKAVPFVKKHAVLLTLLLVLLLQFMPTPHGNYPWGGMWIRMQSKELAVANSAAGSSVENYLRQQAATMANQQYPNLPDANKEKVIADLITKIRNENKDKLVSERQKLVDQIKDFYSYDVNGSRFLYMPDIDPYFYLRYARNIMEKGHFYDKLNHGLPWDDHMVAPVGTTADKNWHPYIFVALYKIGRIFDSKITLMEAANYFPVVFIFLSLIFAFFITHRVAGNIGGFFTVTMLALLPAVMSRTPWGHADTDSYNVLFPVIVVWLLFGAFSAKSYKKQVIFAALTGLAIAVYSNLWSGWWYLFDFIVVALAVSAGVEVITHFKNVKEGFASFWHHSRFKMFLVTGVTMFASTTLFCALTIGFSNFVEGAFKSALGFTVIKSAALPSLWPNVYTTVAELNPASFQDVINSVGGNLMFAIAVLGILLLLVKKDEHGKIDVTYSALLTLWFIGTIYASLKGMRFTILLGPAFAVAFGCAIGLIYERVSSFGEKHLHLNKIITGLLVIIISGIIIVNPAQAGAHMVQNSYGNAVNDVPIVNDAWWNALTKIKDNSQPDAIINSWWDFGHHFKYISDRATTSDGAVQNSPQAHWIGRVLQTDNEDEAISILHMLDCGANVGYDYALNATQDPMIAIKLVKGMIMQDKETARKMAENAGVSDEILKWTHCSPPEDFFITSGDMVGKAGVWAHFGMWDFERAEVWQKWRLMDESEAVPQMAKRFNWSEEAAKQIYDAANALPSEDSANAWISAWPGYLAGESISCSLTGDVAKCGSMITVNLSSKRTEVRVSQGTALAGRIVVYDKKGAKTVYNATDGSSSLTVVMWPVADGIKAIAANTPLADSMFTRLFYMHGLGLQHFKPFTQEQQLFGGAIYVWKVDWNGNENYIPADLIPKTSIESGAQVAVSYIGWTDNNTVFDSSIPDWKALNITKDSNFNDFDTKPLAFIAGQNKVIPGFEKQIQGMKKGETKTITVPPEDAYGTDPSKHPLGNKTLHFKIRVDDVQ